MHIVCYCRSTAVIRCNSSRRRYSAPAPFIRGYTGAWAYQSFVPREWQRTMSSINLSNQFLMKVKTQTGGRWPPVTGNNIITVSGSRNNAVCSAGEFQAYWYNVYERSVCSHMTQFRCSHQQTQRGYLSATLACLNIVRSIASAYHKPNKISAVAELAA